MDQLDISMILFFWVFCTYNYYLYCFPFGEFFWYFWFGFLSLWGALGVITRFVIFSSTFHKFFQFPFSEQFAKRIIFDVF